MFSCLDLAFLVVTYRQTDRIAIPQNASVGVYRGCRLLSRTRYHGQLHSHAGTLARRAADAALSPEQSCPLPNAFQAEMALRNRLGVEPDSPITDFDAHPIPALPEAHFYL